MPVFHGSPIAAAFRARHIAPLDCACNPISHPPTNPRSGDRLSGHRARPLLGPAARECSLTLVCSPTVAAVALLSVHA